MNKTRLLLIILFAMLYSFSIQARKVSVTNAAGLTAAFNGALVDDTLVLAPGYYNVSNTLRFPSTCIVTVTSKYPDIKDSIATIAMNMQGAAIADGVKAGIVFESVNLQHNNPTATSGHIIYFNKFYGTIEKLVFRNCDISNGVRGLFRSVKPDGTTYTSCGDINYLEMTNCLVHNTFVTSGNNWPLLYLGHLPVEVKIENNTFYDLPYMKNIFTMNYADPLSGRNAKISFRNNTVCTTMGGNAYISTGNYLGEESEFTFENNVFILPNWTNSLNQDPANTTYYYPVIVRCVGGIITGKNNMIDGPKPWLSGQVLDLEGNGGFVVIDTTNSYKMADLNFAWTDFADPEKADYSFLSTESLATSGVGGAVIGDPRWVKNFTTPRTLTVSYTPNTVTANVTPRRAYYEDGATAKVTASAVDGYNFMGWKKVSDETLLSTDNPYSFTINSDMDIKADYAAIIERIISITINGSGSATYSITPSKAKYYDGDVVTISLNTHSLNTFLGWSDGSKEMTRTFTLSADLTLTANFSQYPYLLCWDFDQLTANNQTFSNLAANHASDAVNKGIMNYVSLDTVRTISTRNNKFTTAGKELFNCLTRRTHVNNFNNPDYVYIKFSTKLLSKLKVKSIYATDNALFKVQLMQYSLNGKDYTNFASDTIKTNDNIDQIWRPFEGVLPAAAENQDTIYVRWIDDPTSERIFVPNVTTSDYSQIYLTKIIVIDSEFTSSKKLTAKKLYKIYSNADKILVNAEAKGTVEIYSIMGRKIKSVALKTGLNEFTGFKAGVYVVKVGPQVQRVLVR